MTPKNQCLDTNQNKIIKTRNKARKSDSDTYCKTERKISSVIDSNGTQELFEHEEVPEVDKNNIYECTLLAKLHEESCNTNLDPNLSTSFMNSKESVDLFSQIHSIESDNDYQTQVVGEFQGESCQTNLDPYTIIQSENSTCTESDESKENFIKKLHNESCDTNLDPYTIVQSPFVAHIDCNSEKSTSLFSSIDNLSELAAAAETCGSFPQSEPVVNITPKKCNHTYSSLDCSLSLFGSIHPSMTLNEFKTDNVKTDEDNVLEGSLFNSHSSFSYEISQPVCSMSVKRDQEKQILRENKKLPLDDDFWES